jgi:hypothetical protein
MHCGQGETGERCIMALEWPPDNSLHRSGDHEQRMQRVCEYGSLECHILSEPESLLVTNYFMSPRVTSRFLRNSQAVFDDKRFNHLRCVKITLIRMKWYH